MKLRLYILVEISIRCSAMGVTFSDLGGHLDEAINQDTASSNEALCLDGTTNRVPPQSGSSSGYFSRLLNSKSPACPELKWLSSSPGAEAQFQSVMMNAASPQTLWGNSDIGRNGLEWPKQVETHHRYPDAAQREGKGNRNEYWLNSLELNPAENSASKKRKFGQQSYHTSNLDYSELNHFQTGEGLPHSPLGHGQRSKLTGTLTNFQDPYTSNSPQKLQHLNTAQSDLIAPQHIDLPATKKVASSSESLSNQITQEKKPAANAFCDQSSSKDPKEWPKLGIDNEILNMEDVEHEWELDGIMFLKERLLDPDGTFRMNESRIHEVRKTIRRQNPQVTKEEIQDFRARRRKKLVQKFKNFCNDGVTIWMYYLFQNTGFKFQIYLEQLDVKKRMYHDIFPAFLFVVHLIDEVVPRSTEDLGQEDYLSALKSASQSFVNFSHLNDWAPSPRDDVLLFKLYRHRIHVEAIHKEKFQTYNNVLWAFVDHWIYSCRKTLFKKVKTIHNDVGNHFKGFINLIFSLCIDKIINRLLHKISLNQQS